jgi:hypothetical protein
MARVKNESIARERWSVGMRRVTLVLVVAGVLALVVGSGVAFAQAQVIQEHETTPFVDMVVTNPCTGEEVIFSGNLHVYTRLTITPDGAFHGGIYHVNTQDAAGVGLSTGDEYRLISPFNLSQNSPAPLSTTRAQTSTAPLTVVSTGASPNWLLHTTFHFTMNANGTVTADIAHIREECTG